MFEYSILELAHIMSSALIGIMIFICYNELFNNIEITLIKIKKEKELAQQKIKCLEMENDFLKKKIYLLNKENYNINAKTIKNNENPKTLFDTTFC